MGAEVAARAVLSCGFRSDTPLPSPRYCHPHDVLMIPSFKLRFLRKSPCREQPNEEVAECAICWSPAPNTRTATCTSNAHRASPQTRPLLTSCIGATLCLYTRAIETLSQFFNHRGRIGDEPSSQLLVAETRRMCRGRATCNGALTY